MSFFESLLALMFAAILLLQVSRRLALPYPAMLAAAGVVLALIPGAPTIPIDSSTALALFIAPVLLDAAYDFPVGAARLLWRPLVILAVVAVVLTTALVAWIGWAFAGLPLAGAVALGAIVAPPDAAAATAVMRSVSMPRATAALLKGESLFNDATALLIFSAALAIQAHGGVDAGVGLRLALAAPGGVLLGIVSAWVLQRVNRLVAGTLGGNLLQFVHAFGLWIVAEHLGLSAVLAVVAMAMTIARGGGPGSPRMRVHSFAVWATVVFLLNVLAFMLMGMQARTIIGRMAPARLEEVTGFVVAVVVAVIAVRFAVVIGFNRLAAHSARVRGNLPPAKLRQAVIVSWSGMRGLITLATAFALPPSFPQRDLVALTAFAVVLVTLVVQGLTLMPLIRLLKVDRIEDPDAERRESRRALVEAGLATLDGVDGRAADDLRFQYETEQGALAEPGDPEPLERRRRLGRAAIAAERAKLEELRGSHALADDTYYALQEGLDWQELCLLPDPERSIEES